MDVANDNNRGSLRKIESMSDEEVNDLLNRLRREMATIDANDAVWTALHLGFDSFVMWCLWQGIYDEEEVKNRMRHCFETFLKDHPLPKTPTMN